MTKIIVQEQTIKTLNNDGIDYICITDIARLKKTEDPNAVIGNWAHPIKSVAISTQISTIHDRKRTICP